MSEVYAFVRAESEDGDVVGVGLEEITTEHPDYEWWNAYWEREKKLYAEEVDSIGNHT